MNYETIKPIPIFVQWEADAYVASFYEANVHAGDSSDQVAIDLLRSMILDTYDSLAEVGESRLARPALHQWRVLNAYVRRNEK